MYMASIPYVSIHISSISLLLCVLFTLDKPFFTHFYSTWFGNFAIALRVCSSYFPRQNKLDFLYIVASAPKVDLIEKMSWKWLNVLRMIGYIYSLFKSWKYCETDINQTLSHQFDEFSKIQKRILQKKFDSTVYENTGRRGCLNANFMCYRSKLIRWMQYNAYIYCLPGICNTYMYIHSVRKVR